MIRLASIWRTVRHCLLVAMLSFVGWLSPTQSFAAIYGQITVADLVKFMKDYLNSGDAHKQSLAADLQRRFAEANVTFTDTGFSMNGVITDSGMDPLMSCNAIAALGAGIRWTRTAGTWTATVNGSSTMFDYTIAQRSFGIRATVAGHAVGGYSGTAYSQWGYYVPLYGSVCNDLGSDTISLNYAANFRVLLTFSLDVSPPEINSNGKYQIVVGAQAVAAPTGPLSATIDLSDQDFWATSSTGLAAMYLNGAYSIATRLFPGLKVSINGTAQNQLQSIMDDYNVRIRAQLGATGATYELPGANADIQKLLIEIVNSPALHSFIQQHVQEIIFYALVNDRDALQNLIASEAACQATKLTRASMPMPALYSNVTGSCVAVSLSPTDDSPQDLGRYYTDPSCTQQIAFRPTSHRNGYCAETLVTGSPNTHLGNGADWVPDYNQPNDPLPSVPSQKWTTSFGTQVDITTESLSGKAVPFMKRVRYRDVVTARPISNSKALYWDCSWYRPESEVNGPCIGARYSVNLGATQSALLGYIKVTQEAGTVPLFVSCMTYDEYGTCLSETLSTTTGSVLLGYIKSAQEPGTAALSLVRTCLATDEVGNCIGGEGALPQVGPGSSGLGYIYQTGTCMLEMRVYKKDVGRTNLPALLALHGGSWKYRGAAFAGFEAQVAHFTEQGFVVFAPFYRLTGEADGNTECNGATWNQVTADAEAALDWVKLHAGAFGVGTNKPAVMGQSAGGHLAAWLITHRPADIAAGLLLYPPSDVSDFIAGVTANGIYSAYGESLGILEDFFSVTAFPADVLSNPPDYIQQNSFDGLVSAASASTPPVFVLHGKVDSVVPSNQSVLLCNAYGGNAVNSGGGSALRAIYGCGSGGGQLHLFEQAEHALDACLTTSVEGLCFAGDGASRSLVVDSLRQGRTWLLSRVNYPPTAYAGPNQTVYGNTTVTLSGSGSDSDGSIVSYHWTQEGGPAVTISNPNLATTTFTAPKVTSDTVLVFKLTVTDNLGATGWAAVYILAKMPPPTPIPNVAALSWGCTLWDGQLMMCAQWGPNYGPTVPSGFTLLGYVKTVQESGTAPLYWACSVWDYELGRCISWAARVGSGGTGQFLGYVKTAQVSGTAPLYQGCQVWDSELLMCAVWALGRYSALGNLVGYVYTSNTLPPY